jgi:hypothetical protein
MEIYNFEILDQSAIPIWVNVVVQHFNGSQNRRPVLES